VPTRGCSERQTEEANLRAHLGLAIEKKIGAVGGKKHRSHACTWQRGRGHRLAKRRKGFWAKCKNQTAKSKTKRSSRKRAGLPLSLPQPRLLKGAREHKKTTYGEEPSSPDVPEIRTSSNNAGLWGFCLER